jgi:ketosteroid isomerase-like protein
MRIKIAVVASGLVCLGAFGMLEGQKADAKAAAEHYIAESERLWAESEATGDTSTVKRILAEDFVGVDPDGSFYNKAKMVADTRDSAKVFLSNHLDEVKVRFYGDTAIAQGKETWERRAGTPKRARFVWTDTWVLRNGKWQIVAAEDLIAPAASK